MSQIDSQIAVLTRALTERGFVYKGHGRDDRPTYLGSLYADGQAYSVTLAVHPQGLELPILRLDEVPDKLRPVAPHIGADGFLCYAAAGSIVLDVFDIAGQTLGCLQRAEAVLSSILRGEMVSDLTEEFFAYWHGAFCFVDIRSASSDAVEGVMIRNGPSGESHLVITNDRARSLQKLNVMGFQLRDDVTVAVRRIRTHISPRPSLDNWPPRTVSDILMWQGALDAPCRRKLDEHIVEAFKSGAPGMVCLIEAPKIPYAFIVNFKNEAEPTDKRTVTRDRQNVYPASVTPVNCLRIDDEYIAQRNSPEQATLARRRIALIGCGTIGGFLAELAVKAGAGSDGGELVFIDKDILLPQNIGRHRLGINSILINKATALAHELSRAAPAAKIEALPVDAMQANLHGFDLVINATGEEALGHLMTRKLSGAAFVPTLTVWVEGPGTAVRGLLRDQTTTACTRCLNSLTREPLYPVVEGNVPLRLAGHGCESLYVPFSASVSVQAACLGIEMAIAWAGGDAAPRLRTRVLETHLHKSAADQNPPILSGCPACGI